MNFKQLLLAATLAVAAAPVQAAEPQLAHMVFFTLADDTSENRAALVAACNKYLANHVGTVYFSAGTINEQLDREVNDRDFDVALHLVFASRKHHDAYQTHPRHLKFIEENSHLWSGARVFDSNVAPGHDRIAAGGRGFAGMLTGTVVGKQYGQVVLQVATIGDTWRHSKADDPQSLVGQKVVVTSRDEAADVRKFIGMLKVGETVTVDVANQGKGSGLIILELTAKQRARVQQ
jgi:hypothetical protein